MADIRQVTEDFAVAPQLSPEDMPEAAARGFKLVVNNRPDGEAEGQPSSVEMQAAAKAAGLDYRHIPVRGGPGAAEVSGMQAAIEDAQGPVLAYCRSGTRSINTWAIGQAASGQRTREALIQIGRDAGYDLSGVL
jgi:uncharacterized protein (TIGR01244 family)